MIRKIWTLLFILTVSTVPLLSQGYGNTDIVSFEKNADNLKKIVEMRLDVLMEKDGKIFIVADWEDLNNLQLNGLDFQIETQNFFPFAQQNVSVQGGINGDFHSYPELERDLLALESSYPDLARVSVIGTSLENRNIYALKISDNVASNEGEAEVLFIGCHHAREWISVEVPFLLGKYLLENYNSDIEVQNLVDQSEIWIVPLLNPDGLEYSIYNYRYWRKNRRDNGGGSYGVDPNRNYGFQWGLNDEGSSPDPNSETYRGTQPFSEPETQVIRDLYAQHPFQFMISYHSYSQVLLYPWGYTYEPSDQAALLDELAKNMVERMEPVNGRLYDYGQAAGSLYTTNGGAVDWSFGTYGIPSYTLELPPMYPNQGQFFNSEEDIIPIFNENLEACLYMIDWAIQNAPQYRDRESYLRRDIRNNIIIPRIKK